MELTISSDEDAGNRSLPQLAPEIWMQIASELPFLDEPIWVPWRRYRCVSRAFKRAIEDFYLSQVVSGARIYAHCEPNFDFAPRLFEYYGEYWFAGFDDEHGRLAVLRLNEDRCTFGQTSANTERAKPMQDARVVRVSWLLHLRLEDGMTLM